MTDLLGKLADALNDALSEVPESTTACHGIKCREPNCESCCGEECVDEYMKRLSARKILWRSLIAEARSK